VTLAVLASRALAGLDAPAVRVEVHLAAGLPAFHVVGLPDAEVRESRERVRAAILNSGFDFPAGRLTVNLAPADLPKESGRFDLPIALGVLLASGQVAMPELATRGRGPSGGVASAGGRRGGPEGQDGKDGLDGQGARKRQDERDGQEQGRPDGLVCAGHRLADMVFAGELSLTGALVPVGAELAIALAVARSQPDAVLVMPPASAAQAARVPGLRVLAAPTLADVVAHLSGRQPLAAAAPAPLPPSAPEPCLSDVRGQAVARRALEVAAAGGHSLLMLGPPGAGKSMLARRLPGLLPPLPVGQALEAAALAGLAGQQPGWSARPFRAPHHSASAAALVGGGARPRPGEISLAHLGVLFLDELPEFDRRVLEALREPLETGRIAIARALGKTEYPARFQLVAAMNPCPCGWRGHPVRACRCSPEQAARYLARVSGPLLDRIDLQVELPAPEQDWLDLPAGESTPAVRDRVGRCRAVQQQRQGCLNADLEAGAIEADCPLDDAARALLRQAMARLGWSGRAAHRVLRVARTVADLDGAAVLAAGHVAEAIQYRRPLAGAQ